MNPRSSSTSIRRLFVLLCGFEILPKTISTRGRGGRFILRREGRPVPAGCRRPVGLRPEA